MRKGPWKGEQQGHSLSKNPRLPAVDEAESASSRVTKNMVGRGPVSDRGEHCMGRPNTPGVHLRGDEVLLEAVMVSFVVWKNHLTSTVVSSSMVATSHVWLLNM